jgi:hypothetical protein
VQLEKGSSATGFEYRQYGTELALCQRYYTKNICFYGAIVGVGGGKSATTSDFFISYPITMRSSPSVGFNLLQVTDAVNYNLAVTAITTPVSGTQYARLATTHTTGSTQYRPEYLSSLDNSAYLEFNAEL